MGGAISTSSFGPSSSSSSSGDVMVEVAASAQRPFALLHAESSDGESISILEAERAKSSGGGPVANMALRLRRLRHPRLLKLEWEQDTHTLCSLVVEKVAR